MFNIRNIVVTTDFSSISNSAFSYACSLAEQYNAKVHLLYVFDPTPPPMALQALEVSEEQVVGSMEQMARYSLQETFYELQKSTEINIEPVLRKGCDYKEIIGYSEDIKADLIVLATHGRTGIMHSLLGSVTEKVIRNSKIPVLVIPPVEDNS